MPDSVVTVASEMPRDVALVKTAFAFVCSSLFKMTCNAVPMRNILYFKFAPPPRGGGGGGGGGGWGGGRI